MRSYGWIALLALVTASACDSSDANGRNGSGAGGSPNAGAAGQSSGGASGTDSGGAHDSGVANGSGGTSIGGGTNHDADAGSTGGVHPVDGGSTGGADGSDGAVAADSGSSGGSDSAGSGNEGGTIDSGATATREFGYIASRFNGVLACSVDVASGKLSLVGSPSNPTGTAISIAVHPSQKFVYVADENKHVDTYRIAADGTLPVQPDSSAATPDTLINIALDPKGRFAYALSNQASAIYIFAIDSDTGALNPMGDPIIVGTADNPSGGAYIAADPTGHFVYVTALGIRGYAIDQTTGGLVELAGSPFAVNGLPDGDIIFGGAVAFEPTGKFLYDVSLGLLNAFSIDAAGTLTLVPGSPFSHDVQSDPNAPNIAVEPLGEYIYATHFPLNDHISGFRIDPGTGGLTEVPGSPLVGIAPYSIAVEPSGNFVYTGIDGPQVGGYSITRSNGTLTELDTSPFPFGGLEAKIVFATIP